MGSNHALLKQMVKYCCVGMINALVTLLCALLLTWWGVYLYAANLIGYMLGITVSYIFNSKYTFATSFSISKLTKFLIGVALCYLLNIITIYTLLLFNHQAIYFAQIGGAVMYTITGFFVNKFWVLK